LRPALPSLRLAEGPDSECGSRRDQTYEVWRDATGNVAAVGGRRGDKCWIEVPAVGRFSFSVDDEEVVGHVKPGVDPALVEDRFLRAILPLVLQARGEELLHASAVLTPRGIVAVCGESGAGKSSLAYALTRLGHPAYADDAVAFQVNDDGPLARLLPFRLMIREGTASSFGIPAGPIEVTTAGLPQSAPLALIIVLESGDVSAGRPMVEAMRPGLAFTQVLRHGYCFSLTESSRTRATIETYLRLVAAVRVLTARTGPDIDCLPQLAANVSAAVEGDRLS